MPVRIGINYGQVIVEDDSFFGDDINVAARLESFAEAGEVCLSGTVFDRVKDSNAWGFDSFGEERFKNIARPVRVYRVRTEPESLGQVIPAKRRRPKPGRIWRAAAAASLIALLGATGWAVKIQVEKRRAEAEARSVIVDAQSSVATAEVQIERLLDDLRQSEKRATDERVRVEALLASLQAIRNQADRNEQAALEQADEAQDLTALLQAAEERAEVERRNARALRAALEEAENQVTAARLAAEQERQARQDAERRAADQTLMETLLAAWRTAERQAAEERARAQSLLTALQDVEDRAEAERRAKLEQQRTEDLLARLSEAHGLAVRERKRAEDLYAQVQDVRDKVAGQEDAAQQLDGEVIRIEALLGTLRDAEFRVAAERDRIEGMLETLRQAEPSRPLKDPESEPDESGGQWQDADSLERAELLFANWTKAEREAADERSRAEDLLTALQTISQSVRAPPSVPPPKPELPSNAEEPASEEGSSGEPGRPTPGDEQSKVSWPQTGQLAHNPVEETQALRPQEPIVPVTADAEETSWDGTWIGSNSAWAVELIVADGKFLLDATCEGNRRIGDSVAGNIDESGRISAVLFRSSVRADLRPPNPFPIPVLGTPEALEFGGDYPDCRGGKLKLERVADGPSVPIVEFESLDGIWTGEKDAWLLQLTIEDRRFTLAALCKGGITYLDTVTGSLDDNGLVYARISGNFYRAIIFGPPDRLVIVPNFNNCGLRTTIELRRKGREPTVALATEPSFNHFDGKWVGKAVTVRNGARCPATYAIEMIVGGRDFTGLENAGTGRVFKGVLGHFNGTIDRSGKFESKRISSFKSEYHGTLQADSGKGSGEWFSDHCNGTFELSRVEQPSG